ncbi:MAG: shikimate kinase, partial [Planctomycetes bacterium]|nr:shikimate kinase [Planctomycetota bacterium]
MSRISYDPSKPRLYLIGYRGTGKTTVGRLLAERIGWTFVDADVHLEATHGKSIKTIFAEEGEPSFRDKEAQNLLDLSNRECCVIATGGGIVGREANREVLHATGFTVWLTADATTIADRIQADPTTTERRPNLT